MRLGLLFALAVLPLMLRVGATAAADIWTGEDAARPASAR